MNSNTKRPWYFFKGEQHRGPYSTEEMLNLFNLEVIGPWDLVWREGMGTWRAFSEQEEFGAVIGDLVKDEDENEKPVVIAAQDSATQSPPMELSQADEIDLALKDVDTTILPPLPPLEERPRALESETPVVEKEEKTEAPTVLPVSEPIFIDEATATVSSPEEEFAPPSGNGWGKIVAAVAFVLTLLVSGFWLFNFNLQTYELIGLEAADVANFNRVLLSNSQSHVVRLTTDGNVIWAAVPGIIEGEAHLKVVSVPGRVLSTDKIELSGQAHMVQSLAPFRRFDFSAGQQWVRGEYSYQLFIRPKGAVARLASVLAPVFGNSWEWVKIHSRGHSFSGTFTRFEGSARQFEADLISFKEKIWDSLSSPLKSRIEKYQTLERMSGRIRTLWLDALEKAKTGKDFVRFDRAYGRDVAPVLQELVIDSHRLSQRAQEQSPLIAHLFNEIEMYGKEVGRVASELSGLTKKINRVDSASREQLRSQFEELWAPMAQPIEQRLKALQEELVKLEKVYRPKSKE